MEYSLRLCLAIEESEKKLKMLSVEGLRLLAISDRLRRLRKRGLRAGMDYLEDDQEISKTELNKFSKVLFIRQIKEIMGCLSCNEKHIACLEFHHTNPDEKSFNIAVAVNNSLGLSTIIHEIRKCIVICSNCHKKEHWLAGH